MGSLRRGNDQRPTFSATTPHFLQIIPAGSSRYRKLRIPNKFVRACGDHLSNPIHLKLPSGDEWEVDVTKCEGEVWFDKGWQKFSEFHTLDYGDLLVFRYEGNSKFHVSIFDRSATEIDYPITPPSSEETDDESLQILEDFPSYLKSRDKSPLPCPRPQMKKGVSPSSSSETESTSSGSQNVILERTHPLTTFEKEKALQRAIGFKSKKPHVKVALQPSYLKQLDLPWPFVKKHLCKQHSGNINLRVSDGGTWPVYFKYHQPRARFIQGWSEFVGDNSLKVGDVCVFILIEDVKLSFQVVFYRTTEAANCPLSPAGKCKMGKIDAEQVTQSASNPSSSALEAANKFISHNPFFKFTSGSLHNHVHLPVSFTNHFTTKKNQIVTLRVKDRSWRVSLIIHLGNSFSLSAGWPAFAVENCLREGDLCILELIDRDDVLLKVHIFRC